MVVVSCWMVRRTQNNISSWSYPNCPDSGDDQRVVNYLVPGFMSNLLGLISSQVVIAESSQLKVLQPATPSWCRGMIKHT